MLRSNERGYAVMTKTLDAYSLEDASIEVCKRYCGDDDVIAERIPYKIGYSIRITWHKFWKPFYFKYDLKNILWLHWSITKEYSHRTGRIVYQNNQSQCAT